MALQIDIKPTLEIMHSHYMSPYNSLLVEISNYPYK